MRFHRIASALGLAAISAFAVAQERQVYIVQLADQPAASYTGGVAGYTATKPAPGAKFDVNASNVAAYINYLDTQRSNALAQVSAAAVLHRYSIAFDGFSARLSGDEV